MSYVSAGVPVLFTANAVQKDAGRNILIPCLTVPSTGYDECSWLVADEKMYEQNRDSW